MKINQSKEQANDNAIQCKSKKTNLVNEQSPDFWWHSSPTTTTHSTTTLDVLSSSSIIYNFQASNSKTKSKSFDSSFPSPSFHFTIQGNFHLRYIYEIHSVNEQNVTLLCFKKKRKEKGQMMVKFIGRKKEPIAYNQRRAHEHSMFNIQDMTKTHKRK